MEASLTQPLPRIIRFAGAIIVRGRRLAAHLDAERNVLTIDKTVFDRLTEAQQQSLQKTRRSVELVNPEDAAKSD